MNIQPYRRFQTRRECREWVNAVAETEISEGDVERSNGSSHFVVVGCDEYASVGYAWRNPNDAYDASIGERIARGRAVKALADIIWQADTAQAMHKALAAIDAAWQAETIEDIEGQS